ncbi:deoxyuridine 5'-triphosphate nucleotidohydrolase [Halocatena pleomorpha]|uniref:Deoxyuridine 5'-triphosphate nucleotidohydrolase n=1 Tax=Halocatena pleomorpha TaxID=1785090 RepID=A0A3P3RGK9_9EURY|nr:deoxyuridine 5'-triphosphate nucleotidohydrolase [Halocatena pleomorpha]RRJ32667.1 deoxyuridine 5'-triphosphate nucleotidohydrolase [Halocatena pleomorpha]
MFRRGAFVREQCTPVSDDQLQPNGIDLTVGSVFEQIDAGRVGCDSKEIGDRRERTPQSLTENEAQTYYLEPGGYIVRYGETVTIPDDHVGFVYPRSTLMRNSCMLNTAVWDAGYEGKGEGLLQVHHDIELEQGARIAQLVLARANHDETYDGTYQGENVDTE